MGWREVVEAVGNNEAWKEVFFRHISIFKLECFGLKAHYTFWTLIFKSITFFFFFFASKPVCKGINSYTSGSVNNSHLQRSWLCEQSFWKTCFASIKLYITNHGISLIKFLLAVFISREEKCSLFSFCFRRVSPTLL